MTQWPSWTYKSDCITKRDPINVIFTAQQQDIVSQFGVTQWRNPPRYFRIVRAVSDQYLCEGGSPHLQDNHLVKGGLRDRFHVRLWEYGTSATVASAHHEYGLSLGIVPFRIYKPHHPEFERGKWKVEQDSRTLRTVEHDAIHLGNDQWSPFSNGWATRIV